MVAPVIGPADPDETPFEVDLKSFLAGLFAGRGIKGHGDADLSAVGVSVSAQAPDIENWSYCNRSFKLGIAAGFLIHIPIRKEEES